MVSKPGIQSKALHEAAVAFFNADVGVLIIGYDERHGLVDRPDPADDIRRVHDVLSTIHNPGHVVCRELTVDAARLDGTHRLTVAGALIMLADMAGSSATRSTAIANGTSPLQRLRRAAMPGGRPYRFLICFGAASSMIHHS